MDETELTEYIIKRLGEGDAVNEVIRAVSEITGLHWFDAKAVVLRVRESGETAIVMKQFPLLVGLALLTFIGGLALAGTGVYFLVFAFIKSLEYPEDLTTYLWPALVYDVDPLTAIEPAIFPYLRLIIGFLINPFSAILFGGLMVYSSLAGMKNVWRALLFPSGKKRG